MDCNSDNRGFVCLLIWLIVSTNKQMVGMMEILYVQTNCDVFLVDWEKPRGRVSSKRGGSDGSKTKFAPISVWRTLFMANEWNELQTARSYSVEFSFLASATLLLGFDLQYLATPRPDLDLSANNLNMVLRFANTTFWFLVASYGQIFYRWAIHERYFSEPGPQSFVDLCTMAKLSVFILDEEYHGYYLHCRSQHEYSDGNMLEISRQLRQEAEGLTTDRGLPGGPPGVQMYELYLSANWKKQYNHIFRTMMSQELAGIHADKTSFLARVFGRRSGKVPAERLVRASRKLNAFLRGFVDQTTSDFPSVHREQTFVHRFLHVPPESTANSKDTLFLPDKKSRFTKVLLYGQEWNLILFNVLSLGFFDYVYENTVLAIFLAYLLDCAFVGIRSAFGNANVAAKTLVDDRFLK
jgi:meckelin